MTATPAEVVERLIEALNAGDLPAVLALMDPDVAITTLRKGVLRGHAGAEQVAANTGPLEFRVMTVVIDRLVESGDRVGATIRFQQRWRGDDEIVDEVAGGLVFTCRDGLVVAWQILPDPASALALLGEDGA